MNLEWISVKDRMPADDGHTGHVLVARTVGFDPYFGERDVTMGYLSRTGWRNDHGPIDSDGAEITHWMPIPEPPRIPGQVDGACEEHRRR